MRGCLWFLSSLMANCQVISVSDRAALPRLAAICSRIHQSTSDSIRSTARAPSRTGLGKPLPPPAWPRIVWWLLTGGGSHIGVKVADARVK